MRDNAADWSGREILALGIIVAMALLLTVGDGLAAAVATNPGVGTVTDRLARSLQAIIRDDWFLAFPILGIAGFRFVTDEPRPGRESRLFRDDS